jgi:hypothetical protein
LTYSLTKLNEKRFLKNGAIDRHYVVKFNSNTMQYKRKIVDVQDELSEMFDTTLAQATENLQGTDFIRVIIHADSLITPIFVPLQKISGMNSTVIMDHINHVLTSHEDMPLDENFYVDIGTIEVPSGIYLFSFLDPPPFFPLSFCFHIILKKKKFQEEGVAPLSI